jgi:hypothetical protein
MAPRRRLLVGARRCRDLLSELDSERKLPAESAAYGQGVRVVLAVELARWG